MRDTYWTEKEDLGYRSADNNLPTLHLVCMRDPQAKIRPVSNVTGSKEAYVKCTCKSKKDVGLQVNIRHLDYGKISSCRYCASMCRV